MEKRVTRANSSDYEEIISHAMRAFDGVNFPYFMSKIYKDRPEKSDRHYVVRDKGAIVAAVLFNPCTLTAAGVELNVCGVGTVSVDSLYRKSGFMKAIFKEAETELDSCDLAALHGQRQRYEHFGFSPSGMSAEYTVAAENLRGIDCAVDMREVRENDTALLDAMYVRHQGQVCRADRSRADFFDTMFTYGSKPFAYFYNGELIGYMCIAKNKKLIYEVCLHSKVAEAVKQTLAYYGFDSITVRVPLYEKCTQELNIYAEVCAIKHCCNMRINNYPKVIEAFLKLKATFQRLDDGTRSLLIGDIPVNISVKKNKITVTGEIAGDALMLSKAQADTLLLSNAGITYNPVELNWFPLPLFFPDLDNV